MPGNVGLLPFTAASQRSRPLIESNMNLLFIKYLLCAQPLTTNEAVVQDAEPEKLLNQVVGISNHCTRYKVTGEQSKARGRKVRLTKDCENSWKVSAETGRGKMSKMT